MAKGIPPCTHTNPSPISQARLRGNIANPSSPELLHFLFGPLHLVSLPPDPLTLRSPVQQDESGSTSRGSDDVPTPAPWQIVDMSGGPQFASRVRRPHLTSEAVALLRDNVTPSENALWTSLGDSWTRPG